MYGEFYPTGYYGATPQMQDRLAMLEQQRQMQRPPQPMSVRGHLVTGIEEARAAQVMLDGTPSYFPSPAEGNGKWDARTSQDGALSDSSGVDK